MTKSEFDAEYIQIISASFVSSDPTKWHSHVEKSMANLSKDALHYIAQNNDGYVFGDFMIRRAVDLLIFEEVVLNKV